MTRRPRPSTVTRPLHVPLHKRPLVVACSSAGIGFMCGALFWHAIGFWSFVGEVVLRGPNEQIQREVREIQEARVTAATVPAHRRATGSISPVRPTVTRKGPPACSLAAPADDGATDVKPCPAGTPVALVNGRGVKGDRLAIAAPEPDVNEATPKVGTPVAPQPEARAWAPVIRGPVR